MEEKPKRSRYELIRKRVFLLMDADKKGASLSPVDYELIDMFKDCKQLPNEELLCPECHGLKRIYDWNSREYDAGFECPACNGTGYMQDDEIPY